MDGAETMPMRGRELIVKIGGNPRPGFGVKGLLRDVAQKTGIGIRSLERSWKRQYESKNTVSKLQQAADNAQKLASRLEKLADAEEMHGGDRQEVEEVRALVGRLRRLDRRAGQPDGTGD
jgi:transposase-like protein